MPKDKPTISAQMEIPDMVKEAILESGGDLQMQVDMEQSDGSPSEEAIKRFRQGYIKNVRDSSG